MAEDGEEDTTTVTLRVKDQQGDEMFFKVKKETKMQKIMDAYAQRKGINVNSLRFVLDGSRVNAADTPKMLELENDDQIDVLLESVGGGEGDDDEVNDNTVTLRVRQQDGDEMFFKVKKETKMQKIMDAYAQRKGINVNSLRFNMDGNRIQPTDTPKMLELENDDQIDVMLEAIGGR